MLIGNLISGTCAGIRLNEIVSLIYNSLQTSRPCYVHRLILFSCSEQHSFFPYLSVCMPSVIYGRLQHLQWQIGSVEHSGSQQHQGSHFNSHGS